MYAHVRLRCCMFQKKKEKKRKKRKENLYFGLINASVYDLEIIKKGKKKT